jgi:ribonuclease Y
MNPILYISIIILTLILGLIIGFFINRLLNAKALREQQQKAESILNGANEQARLIEKQARDSAAKVVHSAEQEIKERRTELTRESERLDKRRVDLDSRADRLEQRDVTLNKRQSTIDRRANEADSIHEQQMARLQEISQMTNEEARGILMAEVEKEARRKARPQTHRGRHPAGRV